MQDFLERWKEDKKFRIKVKLVAYTAFIVIISIYALSIDTSSYNSNTDYITDYINTNEAGEKEEKKEDIIEIPEQYNYDIEVIIDNENYHYSGKKTSNETTIIKEVDNEITNYIYKDNEYFVEDNGIYIKTNKDEVYDVVNSNYINLTNINTYLNKAEKNNYQYLVYLKDVILGNDSEDYFTIKLNDNEIDVNYTPLIKSFNQNIKQYNVKIIIDEIE